MDVLALILACSVYPDDSLVRAMVELASQGNPHFVGDMTTLATFDDTKSSKDAERIVVELERQGARPVIGLMGLPPSWALRYGRGRSELYDGCTNLWVGSAVLSGHYDACVAAHAAMMPLPSKPKAKDKPGKDGGKPGNRQGPGSGSDDNPTAARDHVTRQLRAAPPEAVRLCALRRYGADLGVDGYAEAVSRLLPRQRMLFVAPSGHPAAAVPAGYSSGDNSCRCEDDDCRAAPAFMPPRRPTRPSRLPAGLPPAPILD